MVQHSELNNLGYLLRLAAGVHRLNVERILAPLSVTAPQLLIMTLVNANPRCSGAELAEQSLLTPPTISIIVSGLAGRDIIIRSAHETNKRVQCLSLSQKGVDLLRKCQDKVQSVEAELESGLTEQNKSIIREWLNRAIAHSRFDADIS